jgi:hypothetical protein
MIRHIADDARPSSAAVGMQMASADRRGVGAGSDQRLVAAPPSMEVYDPP